MKKFCAIVSLLFCNSIFADTKTYEISGMSCGNCAKKIEAEVCKLEGITKCTIEVGKMTLTSQKAIDENDLRFALKNASGPDGGHSDNYQLVQKKK